MRPRALDLYCCAGGVSVGLDRAGFDVTGVDINPQPHYRGGRFVQADALTFPLDGYDFIWASPPCQAHTSLRSLHPDRVYHDLIPATRVRLEAQGGLWCIENVEGAPLGAPGRLLMLCGTMFGLQTPDGRAELRRHRLFETSWPIWLRPACQHGSVRALSVTGHSYHTVDSHPDSRTGRRRTLTVTGEHPRDDAAQREWRKVICVAGGKAMSGGMMTPQGERRRVISVAGGSAESWRPGSGTRQGHGKDGGARETYSVADARAAMGIDWMPMKCLSQAIPPIYAEFIGKEALAELSHSAGRSRRT